MHSAQGPAPLTSEKRTRQWQAPQTSGQRPEAQGEVDGQEPTGQAPSAQGEAAAPRVCALNVEICFRDFALPHLGQRGVVSDRLRIRYSNSCSHWRQTYS